MLFLLHQKLLNLARFPRFISSGGQRQLSRGCADKRFLESSKLRLEFCPYIDKHVKNSMERVCF